MASLTNWYIIGCYDGNLVLKGNVSGHKKLENGLFIHTSKIQGIRREGANLEVYTLNTKYDLKLREIKFTHIRASSIDKKRIKFINKMHETMYFFYDLYNILSEAYLKEKNILNIDIEKLIRENEKKLSFYSEDIREWINVIIEEKIKEEKKLKKRIEDIEKKLKNTEVYLDVGDNGMYYFNFIIIKDRNGNVHKIYEPLIHIGMFKDSVIISRHINDEYYDLRYFPLGKNKIEFYHQIYDIAEHCEEGYINNSGKYPLKFRTTWGKIFLLKPNEEKYISYGITEGALLGSDEEFK